MNCGVFRVALPAAGDKKSKFFTEAQLEENKQKHGERLEDGTFAGRTLREALTANKEEKEARFQQQWKDMKTGARRHETSHTPCIHTSCPASAHGPSVIATELWSCVRAHLCCHTVYR